MLRAIKSSEASEQAFSKFLRDRKEVWRQQISRWWFQKCLIFTTSWGSDPIWLLSFKWVGTTNQYSNLPRFTEWIFFSKNQMNPWTLVQGVFLNLNTHEIDLRKLNPPPNWKISTTFWVAQRGFSISRFHSLGHDFSTGTFRAQNPPLDSCHRLPPHVKYTLED